LCWRDFGQRGGIALAEGPTGCGEQQAVNARGPGAAIFGQALKNRRVLTVDRQQRACILLHGVHEQGAPHHQRFLVRQQQALARLRGRQAGRQTRSPDDRPHDITDCP